MMTSYVYKVTDRSIIIINSNLFIISLIFPSATILSPQKQNGNIFEHIFTGIIFHKKTAVQTAVSYLLRMFEVSCACKDHCDAIFVAFVDRCLVIC